MSFGGSAGAFPEVSSCTSDCVYFEQTGPGDRSAQAIFELMNSGNELWITLSNTAEDADIPSEALNALFFNLDSIGLTELGANLLGDPLGPVALDDGKVFEDDGTTITPSPGLDVGGEWAYSDSVNQFGMERGVSSTGLGIFGNPTFGGSNLWGPVAVDGMQAGILPLTQNRADDNGGLEGSTFVGDSVQFRFTLSTELDRDGLIAALGDSVYFQYGTSLGEVPLPGTLALFALGAMMIPAVGRLRHRWS
jgi:hypothetical protein